MIQFGYQHFEYILLAAQWTVLLSVGAFVGGSLIGLPVAVARTSDAAALRILSAAFIQVFQGIPLLVVMFLSYYGLSIFGYQVRPLTAALLSLSLYAASFLGEIWRGCLQSVPQTQREAALCLGLNRTEQFLHVILPQAVLIAIPPTVGFMVQIVKNTSLASVIGFVELSRAGQIVNNSTFQPLPIFLLIAALYFALCYPLALASRHLERGLRNG